MSLSLAFPLFACVPPNSELSQQGAGQLKIQIDWPEQNFRTHVIPAETQTLELEIMGKGLQGPLREVIQRENGRSLFSKTLTLPSGQKNVTVKALDAQRKLVALAEQTIDIRVRQLSRLEMELKPLGATPPPQASGRPNPFPFPQPSVFPPSPGPSAPVGASAVPAPLPLLPALPSPVSSFAPNQRPGPPKNLRLVEQTSTSLVIQWDFDAQARSHRILKDGQVVSQDHTYPNFFRFEGLTPGQTIRVEIRSVNPFGESEPAQISASTLLQGQSGSGGFGGGGSAPSGGTNTGIGQRTPTLTAYNPFEGTKGQFITLQGTHLSTATSVQINGIEANFVLDENGSDLIVTVPNNPAASGVITVTTPQGTAQSGGSFTYLNLPIIQTLNPLSAGNGSPVTLTGINFTGATSVQFNGINASSFTVNSDSEIVATVPNNPAATGVVTVSNGFGTSTQTQVFTWLASPSLTGFTPTSGGPGTNIVITGNHFNGATAVRFNGHDADSFTVDSNTQITATVPANQPAASGTVSVVTPGGSVTSVGTFSLNTPVIGGFTPTTASAGSAITLTGTNFTGATAVNFNGIPALNFTVNSNTQITATVPNNPGATGAVSVTTPGGSNNLAGFTWNAPVTANPIITSSSISSGGVGQWITLTGLNFTGTTGATFNGTAVASFTLVNDNTLRLRIPTGATTGQIAVTNGTGTGISAFNFTVTPYRTWFVKAGAGGSGGDWQDAMGSLTTALSNAAPVAGTEIWVAAGTYKPHASNRTVSFQLKANVALYGGFAGVANETSNTQRNWNTNLTILSGDLAGNDSGFTNNGENSYRILVGANNAVVDGFRITNGNNFDGTNSGHGGGIYLFNHTGVVLRNLRIQNNHAGLGGGIHQNGGSSVLKDVILTSNKTGLTSTSHFGGGMYLSNNGTSSFENVTFTGNNSSGGGGLDISAGATLTTIGNNILFTSNATHAVSGGGGLSVRDTAITANNLRFSNNSAYNGPGGAIHLNTGGVATLTGAILTNNLNSGTGYGGGAIHINGSGVSPGVLNLHRSVIANSSTGLSGSAIWQGVGGIAQIENSVLVNNSGTGLLLSGGWSMKHNTIYSTTIATGPTNGTRLLRNCIFWQPTATAMMGGLVTYNINNSVLRTNSGYTLTGTNNTLADPLFVNVADPDGPDNLWLTADDGLRLQAGSSALNRAITDLLSPDIAGQNRVNPGDAGAYEFP